MLLNHRVYLPDITYFPVYASYGTKGIGDAWQNWATPTPYAGTTATPGPTPTRGANLHALDYGWYYDWTFYYLPQRTEDPRYVRMVWCSWTTGTDINGATHSISDIARTDYQSGFRGRVWLVYNEPDDPSQCTAFFRNGAAAAAHYISVYNMIKTNDPSAKVFAGGLLWLRNPDTVSWWEDFVDALRADDPSLNKLVTPGGGSHRGAKTE